LAKINARMILIRITDRLVMSWSFMGFNAQMA